MREQALVEFKRRMDEAGIEFMLGHGTCLGAYRDNALIESDHDIDIWLFSSDVESVERAVDYKHRHMKQKLNQFTFSVEGHKFDVCFWDKVGNEYHLNFKDREPDVLPARLAETKPIQFLGETFLIPKYTEEYLEYYYGNWQQKIANRPATVRKANRGICYYTDNKLGEPIFSTVQKYIKEAGLPIVSTSLKPIDFGHNIVVEGERSYPTMVKQIIIALEASKAKYVFFCEHDVLYPKSHFDFTPPKDDIFYYNNNVWRWKFGAINAITYDRMLPLSVLCANREFVLNHYKLRQKKIKEWKLDDIRSREPRWARLWGYEPGTKKKRRGGFTDDDFDTWHSKDPVIDIRHNKTFSKPKVNLNSFKHQPVNWQEISINEIPLWNLVSLFHQEEKSS